MLKIALVSAILALHYPTVAVAAPQQLEARSDVCSSGIYGELAPILKGYSVAQQYCSAKYYPLACTTALKLKARATTTATTTKSTTKPSTTTSIKSSTTAVTIKSSSTTSITTTKASSITTTTKSSSSTTTTTKPSPTTTTTSSSSTTKSTTTSVDTQSSAWSKCQAQGGGVVSTMCSCIIGPAKPCSTTPTSTKATTTTPPTTPSTTSSTTSATPASTGFVACDRAQADGGPSGGCTNCSCDTDADGVSAYCTGTTGSYQDCKTDAECPSGEFCDSLVGGYCVSGMSSDGTQCISTYMQKKRSVFDAV